MGNEFVSTVKPEIRVVFNGDFSSTGSIDGKKDTSADGKTDVKIRNINLIAHSDDNKVDKLIGIEFQSFAYNHVYFLPEQPRSLSHIKDSYLNSDARGYSCEVESIKLYVDDYEYKLLESASLKPYPYYISLTCVRVPSSKNKVIVYYAESMSLEQRDKLKSRYENLTDDFKKYVDEFEERARQSVRITSP